MYGTGPLLHPTMRIWVSQNDILGKRTFVKSPVKSLVVGALLRNVTAIS